MRISDWSSDVCSSDLYSLSQGPGLPDIDKAGEVGAPGSGSTGVFGVPHWTGTVSAGYSTQAFTAFLQGRYVAGRKYDKPLNPDKHNATGTPITHTNDQDEIRSAAGRGRGCQYE